MKVAILIPCYNECATIAKVVSDFKLALPEALIYVYDNNSTDESAKIARNAGAIVCKETRQGKGSVVRSMFRDIDADVYIMVDGDDTYPASEAPKMVDLILNDHIDMVIGDRLTNGTYYHENKRSFHEFGNNLVKGLINHLFHARIHDIMTGYRAFSRRFAKCIPVMSDGFQIETEMTIFSLHHGMNIAEIPVDYRDRPKGSFSKLNTYKDGLRVLITIFDMLKSYRPFLFFFCISLVFVLFALINGVPVITEYLATGYVSKVPSAVLAASLFIIAILMFAIGIILDAIMNKNKTDFELYVNHYTNTVTKERGEK